MVKYDWKRMRCDADVTYDSLCFLKRGTVYWVLVSGGGWQGMTFDWAGSRPPPIDVTMASTETLKHFGWRGQWQLHRFKEVDPMESYTPPAVPKCSCGARAVGVPDYAHGHSHYCDVRMGRK